MAENNHSDLNNLDNRINDRGFFERILKERKNVDEERDRRFDERFEAQEKALDKAEAAQLRVNVAQNDFRSTLKEQSAEFITRAEINLSIRDLLSQIEHIKEDASSAREYINSLMTTQMETREARFIKIEKEYTRRFELDAHRKELQDLALNYSEGKTEAARALAENSALEVRMGKVENFQSRMIGVAAAAPVVTAIIVYLLTRAGG
jgi:hypothetical protein